MIRRTMLAFCAVAGLAAGATLVSPTKAEAEVAISVGDYDDGYSGSYRYRNYGDDDHGGGRYRSRHYHDHDHDCRWAYRRVPSYHWHDGHYGRHGYTVKRVRVCDDY